MSLTSYTNTTVIDLFDGTITSNSSGGWDIPASNATLYAVGDGQDIGGNLSIRKSFLFSNNTEMIDKQIDFQGTNVPPDLLQTTLNKVFTSNKYLVVVNAVVKIDNSCTDTLVSNRNTPASLRMAVSDKIRVSDPSVSTDFWANQLYTEPTASGTCYNWENTSLNLSGNFRFGSTLGMTAENFQKVKSAGVSFFTDTTAAKTSVSASITYAITVYPKNADGSNPIIPTSSNLVDLTAPADSNSTNSTNWGLILGIGGAILALIIIIIIIVVVVKK